jgi:hypothetical protein
MRADISLDWIEDARCRGLDPNLFVPSFNPSTRRGPPKEAFACCNGDDKEPPCPVRQQCLAYGIEQAATGCFGGKALYGGHVRSS